MEQDLKLITLDDNKVDKIENMDKEDTVLFINLLMLENKNERYEELKNALKDSPISQIIRSRLSLYKEEDSYNIVSPYLLAWLENLTGGSPGKAVMWAHTLKEIHKKIDKTITINSISLNFPLGFPSEEGYSYVWNSQKGRSQNIEVDNVLDTNMAWK